MIHRNFDKQRKYRNFPRCSGSETFMLFGETNLKNFMGDGRIRKIKRHERYDEMWVQFGYHQKKKWLIVIFPLLRQIISTLKENDNIHVYGTTDRWGERRVYIIYGIIKFPTPTVAQIEDFSVEQELWKLTKDEDESILEKHIQKVTNQVNHKVWENKDGEIEDDDNDYSTNNEE